MKNTRLNEIIKYVKIENTELDNIWQNKIGKEGYII